MPAARPSPKASQPEEPVAAPPADSKGGNAPVLRPREVPDGGHPAAGPATPPPMPAALAEGLPGAVNTGEIAASNSKQARIKEAEEDRALIALAQAGDHAAFRQLVERHQRRAFAIALSLVRDENDARELVQDAFLRVYKGLKSFQGGSSFFTWLYRIITNLSIDLIRKPGRQLADIDEARFETDESQEAEFPLLSRVDGS